MTVAGLILAAGAGRRAGGPKALLRLGERYLLEIAVETLGVAGLSPLVAVLGAHRDKVRERISLQNIFPVDNPDWESGMFSSIKAGIAALRPHLRDETDGVVVLPVDHPFVSAQTVNTLMASRESAHDAVIPTHEGRSGHPVLIGKKIVRAIEQESEDATLRDILHSPRLKVLRVEVGDRGILANINRTTDLLPLANYP